MMRDYNIIVFTEQKDFFYGFLKYLRTVKCPDNPCLIGSMNELHFIKLPKIELIICDKKDFIDPSFKVLNEHPHFIPVILMASNECWEENFKYFIYVTTILDPINTWDKNWGLISRIRNLWKNPCLRALISESTSSDLLQMIGSNGWTAGVRFLSTLKNRNYKGYIYFRKGQPIYAWSTNGYGSEAVSEMLKLPSGVIDVIKDIDQFYLKNISASLEEILLINALGEDTATNLSS